MTSAAAEVLLPIEREVPVTTMDRDSENADILRIKPRWPIEAVAMRMTTQAIRESLAPPVSSE